MGSDCQSNSLLTKIICLVIGQCQNKQGTLRFIYFTTEFTQNATASASKTISIKNKCTLGNIYDRVTKNVSEYIRTNDQEIIDHKGNAISNETRGSL